MSAFEMKKHSLHQNTDGTWRAIFNIHPQDIPIELLTAPMGAPVGCTMLDYDNPEDGPEKKKTWSELSGTQKAAIAVNDPVFQRWVAEMYHHNKADAWLKMTLDIESKKQIAGGKVEELRS